MILPESVVFARQHCCHWLIGHTPHSPEGMNAFLYSNRLSHYLWLISSSSFFRMPCTKLFSQTHSPRKYLLVSLQAFALTIKQGTRMASNAFNMGEKKCVLLLNATQATWSKTLRVNLAITIIKCTYQTPGYILLTYSRLTLLWFPFSDKIHICKTALGQGDLV